MVDFNRELDPYLEHEGWEANTAQEKKLYATLAICFVFLFTAFCYLADLAVMSFFKWLETL